MPSKEETIISELKQQIADLRQQLNSEQTNGSDQGHQTYHHQLMEQLIESNPNGILMVDNRGKIQLANKKIETLFGYTQHEVIGKSVEMFVPPDFRKGHVTQRKNYDKKPKVRPMGDDIGLWGIKKDGVQFPIEIALSPIESDGNRQTLAVIIDISERYRAYLAEKEYNQKLEAKNQELYDFTYIASHDLQEPINTITAFSQRLMDTQKDSLDEQAQLYVKYIHESSLRSRQLIVDLLDYSRIGKDKEVEEVNLNKLLTDVLMDLSGKVEETQAEIVVPTLPTLMVYGLELRLVFQNLLGNALKFIPADRKPHIQIKAKQVDDYWQFAIVDNGIGIEKKNHDKIFAIFKRLHKKSDYEGTGIGLANCKKSVELHQGKMWLKSEPNKGSAFYFSILNNLQ